MMSKEIGRNWSSFLESFFNMWIPSVNPQLSAINFFLWASRKSFQRSANILGHFLKSLYEIPLIPGELLALAFLWKSFISPNLKGEYIYIAQ